MIGFQNRLTLKSLLGFRAYLGNPQTVQSPGTFSDFLFNRFHGYLQQLDFIDLIGIRPNLLLIFLEHDEIENTFMISY